MAESRQANTSAVALASLGRDLMLRTPDSCAEVDASVLPATRTLCLAQHPASFAPLPQVHLASGSVSERRPVRIVSHDDEVPTQDLANRPTVITDPEASRNVPQRIGPYRLLERLGEGGMGEVWLARQDAPRRKVALKLIRAGMSTREVVARFEAERQALALMDHPSIAKVFDAGESELGRPYFVMEYVRGQQITAYCDRQRLSTKERLELFLEICSGVQHAHQKGVIHRDLKPSNILVTEQDGRAIPKIIDFGIAKAINRELTEQTLFTELGQIVGTPEYMAPEQADLFDADVDTRADIYSLGVLLYELLVGTRPFQIRELRRAGLAEIHRHIREVEPPKPSTRLSTLETGAQIAELRSTDPGSLIRVLRGDLDWITMKALEKERARRYGSANDLLQDVERHLSDRPVLARPPSLRYQATRFVRRNRLATAAVTAVSLALVLGASIATWQAREARRAERLAQEQAQRADRQALTSDRVTRFLLSLFRSGDPYRSQGAETLDDVLDRGLEQIDDLGGEPLVQSDLLITLGDAMINTGRRESGLELIDRALALREGVLPEGDADLLYYRWFHEDRSGTGPVDTVWRDLARATHEALTGRQDVISRNRMAQMLLSLGTAALVLDDDLPFATDYTEQALGVLEELEESTGQRLEPTPTAIENLGFLAILQSDLETAEAWYRKGLRYSEEVHGKDHVRYAQSLGQYAALLRDLERFEEAEKAATEAYERRLAALGRETGTVVYDLLLVTSVYRNQNELEEAERWARETLAVARRIGEGLDRAVCVLGDVLAASGALAGAEALLEEAAAYDARESFDCRRGRGLVLIARGDLATGHATLNAAWEERNARDPANLSVRALAQEAERALRQAGDDPTANTWQQRFAGAVRPE